MWMVNIANRKINVMQKHSLFGLLCKTVHYDAFLCIFFPSDGCNFVSCFHSKFQWDTKLVCTKKIFCTTLSCCWIFFPLFAAPSFVYILSSFVYFIPIVMPSFLYSRKCVDITVLLKAFQKCLCVNKCKFLNTQI